MVELVIRPFDALPCRLEKFTINGIKADQDDFGYTEDMVEYDDEIELNETDYDDIDRYGCRNRQFFKNNLTEDELQTLLNKYSITKEDYDYICEKLKDELYVGCCGWCI